MENCVDHQRCEDRVVRLEESDKTQWDKIDSITTRLNLILGGVIISPFIIAVITLLIKVKI
jgi:hypothetical protein